MRVNEMPTSLTPPPSGWPISKGRIHTAQQRTTLAVNRGLLVLADRARHVGVAGQPRVGRAGDQVAGA